MVNKFSAKSLCKSCKAFINKYSAWNESKVPEISITNIGVCRKCKIQYEIYKKMIYAIRWSKGVNKKGFGSGVGREVKLF